MTSPFRVANGRTVLQRWVMASPGSTDCRRPCRRIAQNSKMATEGIALNLETTTSARMLMGEAWESRKAATVKASGRIA